MTDEPSFRGMGEDGLEVEWDPVKAREALAKHAIEFREAATVFLDPLARTRPDPEHSQAEDREVTIGHTTAGRLVVVAHTPRRPRIRLISARPATPAERRNYERP